MIFARSTVAPPASPANRAPTAAYKASGVGREFRGCGLRRLEQNLTVANLKGWTASHSSEEVEVYLPKFKMTSEFQMNNVLTSMGIPSAFDARRADFSGMNGKKDLYISAVIHKAFVDVNEEGTEAAAATGIVMRASAMPDRIVFRADHPFVFFIRDNRTDSILFMGRVVNPKP